MLTIKKLVAGLSIVLVILLTFALNLVPDYFFASGLKYFKAGNYQKAYEKFSIARRMSPSNSDYRYYVVQTLIQFKPTVRIQKKLFEFVDDGIKDSASVAAGIQVAVWKNNIDQLYGSTYIEQAPINSDIIRWNPKTFPLKVYIDLQDVSEVPEYYNTEVPRAFGQWQASSGFLSFKFINSPDNADIVVKFAPLPKNNCSKAGCKYVVAHTIPTIKKNILKQMTITVYDRDANGNYFSDKELYNTVLHEIGHALGIMGHSYSTDDLMYMAKEGANNPLFTMFRSDFQYISVQDISTLRLLYNIVPTITNTPIDKIDTNNLIYPPVILGTTKNMSLQKIKEAENYIAQAPNIPNGYIDLAIAYDELGKFEDALSALQKAFNLSRSDTDKYIVLYNIAAMYLNNNKPDTALGYALQAQNISDTDEIADLISNIQHSIETKTSPFKGNKLLK